MQKKKKNSPVFLIMHCILLCFLACRKCLNRKHPVRKRPFSSFCFLQCVLWICMNQTLNKRQSWAWDGRTKRKIQKGRDTANTLWPTLNLVMTNPSARRSVFNISDSVCKHCATLLTSSFASATSRLHTTLKKQAQTPGTKGMTSADRERLTKLWTNACFIICEEHMIVRR